MTFDPSNLDLFLKPTFWGAAAPMMVEAIPDKDHKLNSSNNHGTCNVWKNHAAGI